MQALKSHKPITRNDFRSSNPFQGAPLPVPLDGWNLRAPEIFRQNRLADHLERNRGWLEARPRTSNQIDDALFQPYALAGMHFSEVRLLLNHALWDAGYKPSNESENPTWTWTDGE